ncbi:hypothetical protein N656DRAFT_134670 [Canariomyces notabilis]|uniref:Uncharacterized protein n=1 Tax=Canariomyces notabilis TaxID=2074819 RepID=A0AAN6TCS0_9PEZI|nr:hypothetical protein N656DRAFT_134670 [Canariomyces arenarius]
MRKKRPGEQRVRCIRQREEPTYLLPNWCDSSEGVDIGEIVSSIPIQLSKSRTRLLTLGEEKVVKPRPQQNNRNRIVRCLPLGKKSNRTLRIALKCTTTSFVTALPEETWEEETNLRVERHEGRSSPRPCFSDANYRRAMAPSRHRQGSLPIKIPKGQKDGRANSEADSPNFSYACARKH